MDRARLSVDLPTMGDVVKIDPTKSWIELVKNAMITNAQLVFGTPRQFTVRKAPQSHTHFVHLGLHRVANLCRK